LAPGITLAIFASLSVSQPSGSVPLPSPPPYERPPEGTGKSGSPALESVVLSAAKAPVSVEEAASVVAVVTREEIARVGYVSVAEAIERIPGVYFVDDHTKGNLGVRGVSGGSRGWSSVVKVLIDGQPFSFRPDTSNYVGMELIPIECVQQIEVIRGPASALYGANAFLGVINVVTRSGGEISGASAGAFGGGIVRGGFGGGAFVVAGEELDRLEVVLGTNVAWLDRSGLTIAESSPLRERIERDHGSKSIEDTSIPFSAFGRASYRLTDALRISVDGLVNQADTAAEWQDWGPLSHGSRIIERNGFARAAAELREGALTVRSSATFSAGGPAGSDRIDIGRPGVFFRRLVGYTALDGTIEGRYLLGPRSSLVAGADIQLERHELQRYEQITVATDSVAPIGTRANRTFRNLAAYAQAVLHPLDFLGVTAGVRVDSHDVYGTQPSGRLALIALPAERLAIKLLYGGSFKAPSAVQLFTVPITTGDVKGNERLEPQTAHVIEAAFVAGGTGALRAEVVAFYMLLFNQVVFALEGGNQIAQNLGQVKAIGGELDVRYALTPSLSLFSRGSAVSAKVTTEGTFFGARPDRPELSPQVQGVLGADVYGAIAGVELALRLEAGFVGSRGASQSNVLLRGAAYALDAYPIASASVSTIGWQPLWGKETKVRIAGENLLNASYDEPGFGGVDIPQPGLRAWLLVAQDL
jgi:outer membrane receptor for ferrienterochelin and colicins